ncbi:MAG: hypothetical protein ACOYXT_18890 [Bacteroidota bacterium]
MTTKNVTKINQIKEAEINELSSCIFQSFLVTGTQNTQTLVRRSDLLDDFIDFLGKYLAADLAKSNKHKLAVLNSIDKLTLQKELLQLRKKEIAGADIKEAGRRSGRKSQSAFKKK